MDHTGRPCVPDLNGLHFVPFTGLGNSAPKLTQFVVENTSIEGPEPVFEESFDKAKDESAAAWSVHEE